MGMNVDQKKQGIVADPNIVPLIDVLLVLIIIFMVLTPKVPTGLPTIIPQPAPPQVKREAPPETIVVQVLHDGTVKINQDASNWDLLGSKLGDIFKERADKVAFVRGEDQVSFDRLARAIDIMRGAGIEHVGLITAGVMREE